jgi:drug/metabolite transporter (DMT)-like permease
MSRTQVGATPLRRPTGASLASNAMTQLLALLSAALFGIADFAGGLATKRISAWTVVGWSQLLGIPILVLGLIIVPSPEVSTADLGWGAVGGVFGLLGIAVMYMALAAGTMSVIAPIIGVGAAFIPVIWAVFTGESINAVQWGGVFMAGVAVTLIASQQGAGRISRKLATQAFMAAVSFAIFFIALGQTSESAGLWPLFAARALSLPLAFGIILAVRAPVTPTRALMPLLALVGFFDMTANAAIVLAVQRGPIGINAVVGSLYPAFTVIAAIIVLKERPTGRQLSGLALALLAVLALAL